MHFKNCNIVNSFTIFLFNFFRHIIHDEKITELFRIVHIYITNIFKEIYYNITTSTHVRLLPEFKHINEGRKRN